MIADAILAVANLAASLASAVQLGTHSEKVCVLLHLPCKVTMLCIFQSLRYVELNDRLQLPLINVKLHKHILRILVDRIQLLKLLRGLTPRPLVQSFPYQHNIFFGLSLLQECSERKHILFSVKLS